jgi:hypothetical protein
VLWQPNVISRRRGANRSRASGALLHPPSPRLCLVNAIARRLVTACVGPHPAGTEIAARARTVTRARVLRRKAGVRISAAPSSSSLALSPKGTRPRAAGGTPARPSKQQPRRHGRCRRDAATRSALPTSLLLVQTSSREPAARRALGGFRSACVSSHAGDAGRRCWSDETEQSRAGRGRPVPSLLPFVLREAADQLVPGAVVVYGSHTSGGRCWRRAVLSSRASANVTRRSSTAPGCSSRARPKRYGVLARTELAPVPRREVVPGLVEV